MFMKKSKLFKGKLNLDHNVTRIELMIDTLLKEIDLEKYLTKKSIKDYNKLDIDIILALMTAKLETAKAIQFGIAFLAFLLVSVTGIATKVYENPIEPYIFMIIVATFSVTGIEWAYRNKLMNYTYLKELLLIYRNNRDKP